MACRWLALGLCVTPVLPLAAQGADARVDALFARYAATSSPGCVVGVRHRGATVLERAWGMADLEHGLPLTVESRSESGSVAKQFTAAAIALLAQDGKLSLDDDIRRWIPEVPDFGPTIRVRHLLNHTSGLRDQWGLLSLMGRPPGRAVHTVEEIVHLVSRQRELNFPPGAEYLYSNTGYTLLGVIVDRVSGYSLADFSRARLFEPLGMASTAWRDDFTRIEPRRAQAYDGTPGRWRLDMPFTMVYGNGGLLTTVGDLLRWNAELDSGAVLPGLRAMLETQGVLVNGRTIPYALGVSVQEWRGVREVSHSGSTAGYRAWLARYPDARLSVALLCNVGAANPGQLGRQVAEVWLGNALAALPAAGSNPDSGVREEALAGWYGIWADPVTDAMIALAPRDGRAVVGIPGGGASSIATVTEDGPGRYRVGGATLEVDSTDGRRVLRVDGAGDSTWFRPVTLPDTSRVALEELIGRYASPELGVIYDLSLQNGRLSLQRVPDPPVPLVPVYRDGFRAGGRSIRMTRDATGRVNGFLVFAGRVRALRFVRDP